MDHVYVQLEEQDSAADQPAWIAAQYNTMPLPREVNLGDGSYLGNGKYYNQPLMKHWSYRMFIRSYVSDDVSFSLTSFTYYNS